MKNKFVYLVTGITGEYSDKRDWYVAATLSKELAETLLSQCRDEYSKALAQCHNDLHELRQQLSSRKEPKDFGIVSDQYFQVDYSGTDYGLIQIPLI